MRSLLRVVLFSHICLLFLIANAFAAMPDFGPDGLKGLTKAQIDQINQGTPVTTETDDKNSDDAGTYIQAAVIFNKSPEEVWGFLTKTEDQEKYFDELKSAKVIRKEQTQDCIEFVVKVMFVSLKYRVIHRFDKANLYYYWALDPSFKNEMKDLKGFWRFYPYPGGKTLGRYGSNVSPKGVPDFVLNMFKKNGVKDAMVKMKKYVDSNGTYRKP